MINVDGKYYMFDSKYTDIGKRFIITKNMEELYSCIQVDNGFFRNCYKIRDTANTIQINGCQIDININLEILPKETFNILLGLEDDVEVSTSMDSQKISCESDSKDFKIRPTLESWIDSLKSPYFSWFHYTKNSNPINPKNPEIDIVLHNLKNNRFFYSLRVQIETLFGEVLFKGDMIKGRLSGKVNPNLVNHPGWRSRLTIRILDFQTEKSSIGTGYIATAVVSTLLYPRV